MCRVDGQKEDLVNISKYPCTDSRPALSSVPQTHVISEQSPKLSMVILISRGRDKGRRGDR